MDKITYLALIRGYQFWVAYMTGGLVAIFLILNVNKIIPILLTLIGTLTYGIYIILEKGETHK